MRRCLVPLILVGPEPSRAKPLRITANYTLYIYILKPLKSALLDLRIRAKKETESCFVMSKLNNCLFISMGFGFLIIIIIGVRIVFFVSNDFSNCINTLKISLINQFRKIQVMKQDVILFL